MPSNRDGMVLSHWHALFEGFSASTPDFYTAVGNAVSKRELPEVEISRVLWKESGIISAEREYLRVRRRAIAFDICSAPYGGGHFFSWWLARLPPRYGIFMAFGIILGCLAALGLLLLIIKSASRGSCAGFVLQLLVGIAGLPAILLFLGYLVREGTLADEEWVLSLPILGWLYELCFNPSAYHELDTAMAFRESIRAAVEEVVNGLREAKGLRALSAEEWKPHEGYPAAGR